MNAWVLVLLIPVVVYLWIKLRSLNARHSAAVNVLLGKYTFINLSEEDKQRVREKAIEIIERSGGVNVLVRAKDEYGDLSLLFDNEAEEYGWYALSMAELGIPPRLTDKPKWNFVRNPFVAIGPSDKMLGHVGAYLRGNYGINVPISRYDRLVEKLKNTD